MREVKELNKELENEIASISDSMWDGLESAEGVLQGHGHNVRIDNLETAGVADDDENWVVHYTVTVIIEKEEQTDA